ncbi:response regulator [Aequorivita lipolytica]|uniref:Response regulator n=1 Tax=Aequorivita lipolytica TaxID=153267 RepID=A0A5C6YTQ2_9FLAO|nr:response regulator [Aequorivita lipolytica]TXD70838.1 response regulator [Aequorivita lipolytica]SRX49887.1 Response regulator MprA [Aequorivita lipolytica]
MKNILIVEDDRIIGEMLKYMFTSKGYKVWVQQHPGEIDNNIQENRIDLVLLDKFLGGLDGLLICNKIKTNNSTAHVPVIMMSALEEAKAECIQAGAHDFITKPFDMNDFFNKIEKVFNQTD